MSAPALEPYATRQYWEAREPLPGDAWHGLMVAYLSALARACEAAGPCIIGHIKALALFENGDLLRISAVSAHHPPTLDGRVPDGIEAVSLTLNVLVYSLSAAQLKDLTWAAAAALAQEHGVTVSEETTGDHPGHRPTENHSHAE